MRADGSISVVALISRPGQATSVHDHTTWCAVGLSLHVYGTDIRRLGNSVRRTYDLPIVEPNEID